MKRLVKVRLVVFGDDQVITVKVPVNRSGIPDTEIIRRAGNALRLAADQAEYTVTEGESQ